MQSWFHVAQPRREVREGRSFNPDEFAIALEQVTAGRGPEDYRDPVKFFARTCFTRNLREHLGTVLRRLSGETQNAAPVMTLITQFGGGKTHTLTALYHLAKNPAKAKENSGVAQLLAEAGISRVPKTTVAVFVGNAWGPREGRETPWIDVARQLADDAGVAALGTRAKEVPPGTDAIARLIQVAGGSVLILFDEVLNYTNRHRGQEAESFHAFIHNLTVAMTGSTHSAAMIALPRSQVEMTDWDLAWQEKITRLVRRVAKDLIANDEAEISEVVRKRLFEDLTPEKEKVRKAVAKTYADWCFERRAQLPPEWTAVDTATTEARGRDFLRSRFEACYPFHPATISVFQRKWQGLSQFQQTRGALAMFAQWISWVFRRSHIEARPEALITLGSAPLDVAGFRAVVLGQLGESRLQTAIDTDISGQQSHARALDADSKGPLRDIHRRVGAATLFESSGGQKDKAAHLPELRFALGEPGLETTSIDSAAADLEAKGYYLRKKGTDGYFIGFKPTLKKVVSDRRASLDEDEIKTETKATVKKEFERGLAVPWAPFPEDGTAIQDSPRLTLVVLDPEQEWEEQGALRDSIAEWTRNRGKSPRLYPGSLIWCVRKPGRDLRDKVENLLAWRRVQRELAGGTLEGFDRTEQQEVNAKLRDAESAAQDEVWAGYRYVILADSQGEAGLGVIDLGAGHASAGETLYGRIITALRTRGLLNESPGAGYLERKWPPPFKESGAWPLSSLRQAFLNGTLERLIDPDAYLRSKLPELVLRADFGLASGAQPGGSYSRVWFQEMLPPEEVTFDADVYLLTKKRARQLAVSSGQALTPSPGAPAESPEELVLTATAGASPSPGAVSPASAMRTIRISGEIPTEVWNRLGRSLIPKLKSSAELHLGLDLTFTVDSAGRQALLTEIRQILQDLNLTGQLKVDSS